MHTTEGKTLTFHHNGDYSGDVKMMIDPEKTLITHHNYGGKPYLEIEVPFQELRDLVLDYLRRKEIANICDMSNDDYVEYLT